MKQIFCLALLATCVFSLLNERVSAQVVTINPLKVSLYDKFYEDSVTRADEVFSMKAFEDFKFKNKKTGKVDVYKDLAKFKQEIIQIMAVEKLTANLHKLTVDWEDELKVLKVVEGEKLSESKDAIANRTDVIHYKDKPLVLRSEVAVKYEKVVEEFFNVYSDKFTKEEISGYIGHMKRFHDANKLIKRGK